MTILATHVRRYGADRTEIARDDGTRLGWIDNVTGEVHAETEQFLLEIRTWIADRGER